MIEGHCLVVTRFRIRNLCAKTLGLILWIVQLGKAVGDLSPSNKKLEAICQEWIFIVASREWRHLSRVLGNKCWLPQISLARLLKNLDLQFPGPIIFLDRDIKRLANTCQVVTIAQTRIINIWIEVLDDLGDGHAGKPFREIKGLTLIRHFGRAQYRIRHTVQQCLDHHDEILVISIGAVQLQHRKFRVVLSGYTLVAETTINLIDTLKPTDDQTLQI